MPKYAALQAKRDAKRKTILIAVRLNDEDRRRLKHLAEMREVSVSQAIRSLIKEAFERGAMGSL